jgi:hypothetical protein
MMDLKQESRRISHHCISKSEQVDDEIHIHWESNTLIDSFGNLCILQSEIFKHHIKTETNCAA